MSLPRTTGQLYTLSAPSGAGKTSLVKALLQQLEGVVVSTSHTTRAPRPAEIDGRDYHFIDPTTFLTMVEQRQFLEHAQVFDHFYGTARSTVDGLLQQSLDVILEIDWQGAQQVRQQLPDTIAIFILPPNRTALEQRLCSRAQDSAEVIARRMAGALSECSHYTESDYLIINDHFDRALAELTAILTTQRQRTHRQQQRYAALLQNLLAP